MNKDKQSDTTNDAVMQERINTLKKSARIKSNVAVILFVSTVISFGWAGLAEKNGAEVPESVIVIGVVSVLATVVMIFVGAEANKKTNAFISENITHDLLAEIFEIDEYNHEGSVSLDGVRASRLIDNWENCDSAGDLMRGKYKGRGIAFSDMHLVRSELESRSEDADTVKVTVFKGIWIFLEQDRDVTSYLKVRDRLSTEVGSVVSSSIQTENMDFNSRFQIRSDDDHSAFLILTPHFMERLKKASLSAYGHINVCFYRNTTCIAISNYRNTFTSSQKDKSVEEIRAGQRAEIRYVTNILDEFLKNDYLYGNPNPSGVVSECFAATRDKTSVTNNDSQTANTSKVKMLWDVVRSFNPIGLLLLAIYAASAIFTLWRLPYGIVLSTDIYNPDALVAPTAGYLIFLSVFVFFFSIPALLFRRGGTFFRVPTSIVGTVVLIMIHVLFVMANISR